MAIKRPLALYDGRIEELRTVDSLPHFGGAVYRRGSTMAILVAANASALATSSLNLGRTFLVPFVVARDVNITQLRVEVTTAGSGSTIYAGIYDTQVAGGVEYPGGLLASVTASGDTAGYKSWEVSLTLYPGQIYWTALLCTGTTAAVVRNVTSSGVVGLFGQQTGNNAGSHLFLASQSNLQNPAPTSGYTLSSGNVPILYASVT